MALSEQQRSAKSAALQTARAALAAKRALAKEANMPAPEGLMTTVSSEPQVDQAILDRAAAQLNARILREQEALLSERDRQGYDPKAPTPLQRGNRAVVEQEAAKARAARQHAIAGTRAPEMVNTRITKMGDGKVSMGIHVAGIGEACYERNEEPELPLDVAQRLDDLGFAEIQD